MDKINIRPSEKGSLHRALGVPANSIIPATTIARKLAGNPSPAMKKKLVFAQNARSFGK